MILGYFLLEAAAAMYRGCLQEEIKRLESPKTHIMGALKDIIFASQHCGLVVER